MHAKILVRKPHRRSIDEFLAADPSTNPGSNPGATRFS
jgi:hypothetical protein